MHPNHPVHCKCNSHEDRPVRFVGCTPTTPRVTSQMSRELGVIFCAAPTCGSWGVLWEVTPTKKQKSLSGIHGNSSNGSGAEFRLQKFSSKKNERTLACFCIRAQNVCPGYNLISRWIPKGMLPHSGRKIHHLHGIGHTHSQQTSLGESFPGDASNKWLWHLPPEHHCSPATAPNLPLLGSSSPSMRPRLGCHPRSPMIQ